MSCVLWVVVHIQADLAFEVLSGMFPQRLAKNVHLVSSATPDTPRFLRDELHVSLCVNARRCVAICGDVWRCVAMCGDVWRCVAMCGDVRRRVCVYIAVDAQGRRIRGEHIRYDLNGAATLLWLFHVAHAQDELVVCVDEHT